MKHSRLKFAAERRNRVGATERTLRSEEHAVRANPQEDLLRRVMWRESQEYRQITRWRWPAFLIGIAAALLFAYFWFLTDAFPTPRLEGASRVVIGVYAALFLWMIPPYLF